jgi:hypothetical protein
MPTLATRPDVTAAKDTKGDDMTVLGPQLLNIVYDDGETEVIRVSFRILTAESIDLGDNISVEMETGEIIFEYDDEDEAPRKLAVSAPNTFALVGTAIMIAEADIMGLCNRQKATVYRYMPGDVKKPGDMFR